MLDIQPVKQPKGDKNAMVKDIIRALMGARSLGLDM